MAKSAWKRSSKCGKDDCCVEISVESSLVQTGHPNAAKMVPHRVYVRNSASPKNVLSFTADEWRVFLDGARFDEFNI